MADKVHPTNSSPPRTTRDDNQQDEEKGLPVLVAPQHGKSVSLSFPPGRVPPPGTYVVQLPKDQILRYPPPPSRLPYRARNPRKRSRCRCCCLSMLIALITLLLLVAIFAGVFYFVYTPKAPKYSIDNISIQGFNLTSSPSSTYSPKMDVTVRARNPNGKIGIYYVKGSSVSVSHSNVGDLCTGVLPVFYQPTKNTTVFNTTLNDAGSMMLSTENYQTMRDEQRKKQIPLKVNMEVPVKIKFGSIKTWTITVKVRCSITVDSLEKNASILSDRTKCSVDVNPWG